MEADALELRDDVLDGEWKDMVSSSDAELLGDELRDMDDDRLKEIESPEAETSSDIENDCDVVDEYDGDAEPDTSAELVTDSVWVFDAVRDSDELRLCTVAVKSSELL